MASRRVFIEWKDEGNVKDIDSSVKNKWNWNWMEKEVEGTMLSECIRKLPEAGKAFCLWCNSEILYGRGGLQVLKQHVKKQKHRNSKKLREANYKLSAEMSGPSTSTSVYGMHPFFKPCAAPATKPLQAMVPLVDRVANQEAMLLGFLAEKSLPFTLAPELIELSKALASDPKVLNQLSMDRNTASYKMRFGLAKTMQDELIHELQTNKFSMNIDEATSDNNQKILTILVSYFSPSLGKVIINHLASLSLIVVNSATLQNELDSLLKRHNIPWTNVVSILMDSCNVMRGSKSGLETRLRADQAPHLLDIDGDTCHHVHNAAKRFSKAFDQHLQSLFTAIYTDFKWSTDLRDYLKELCLICDIKFTMPERYVPTRWLSVYDVAVDTLRLLDVFTIFYFPFLSYTDRTHYRHICHEVCLRREIGDKARSAVIQIQEKLKSKKMTKEGEQRKVKICEKLFVHRSNTKLHLHFYASVLPLLKKYVLLFQQKQTWIHKLHDEIEELTKNFFACFIKPEVLLNCRLSSIEVEGNTLLKPDDMFVGSKVEAIFAHKKELKAAFLAQAQQAYVSTGKCLKEKLPLNNKLLKHLSAVDPLVRGHSKAMKYMKVLPKLVTCVLDEEEHENFCIEVMQFHSSSNLPSAEHDTQLDVWWAGVMKTAKYPTLCKMVKAILSCFHGPQVEGSFSIMGNVITPQTSRLNIKTFDAIQSVKFSLQASSKSAVRYFKRKDIQHDNVNPLLVKNLRSSHKKYAEELDEIKQKKLAKTARIELKKKTAVAKQKAKEMNLIAAQKARKAHRRAMLIKLDARKRRKARTRSTKTANVN